MLAWTYKLDHTEGQPFLAQTADHSAILVDGDNGIRLVRGGKVAWTVAGAFDWSLTLGVADPEIDVHAIDVRGNSLFALQGMNLYSVTLSDGVHTI